MPIFGLNSLHLRIERQRDGVNWALGTKVEAIASKEVAMYAKSFSRKTTRQSQRAHALQVENRAGGYTFVLSDLQRLDRFLVLGAEGNTYYATARELTLENAAVVLRCLETYGAQAVERIVEVSTAGRAPKNDPAVFALALAASHDRLAVRKLALANLSRVCRTGTHLLQSVASVDELRGWGRALREAISDWYSKKDEQALCYQIVKYRNRYGFTHRDVLRKVHVEGQNSGVFRWIADREATTSRLVRRGLRETIYPEVRLPAYLSAFEQVQNASNVSQVIQLIEEYRFTHEMIPNRFLAYPQVWRALLVHMPLAALVRNLGKMSSLGVIDPLSGEAMLVVRRLTDRANLKRARVHPLFVLNARATYASGRGLEGSLRWAVNSSIVAALDQAFYLSFDVVEPAGKNTLIALDVSGSMGWAPILGTRLTPAVASAAMALVTLRTEPRAYLTAFSTHLVDVPVQAQTSLSELRAVLERITMGGTDCSLPMRHALERRLPVDTFVVYTDNETWAGDTHPHQALEAYRRKTGRLAKLIVVGMTATQSSIANPDDAGMLDVVGFDSKAPAVISDFSRG